MPTISPPFDDRELQPSDDGHAMTYRLRVILAALAIAMLGACAMSQSTLVEPRTAVGCDSSAGAYNLTKSYIAFDITREQTGIAVAQNIANNYGYFIRLPGSGGTATESDKRGGVAVLVKPDPEATYCLDYLASITSNDTFEVQKLNHILQKITSKADDQSAKVAENFVKTLFAGISGNANFDETLKGRSLSRTTLGDKLVFSGVVDPFDHDDVNRTNDAIRAYGYCLFIEGEPIDPNNDDVDAYCDNPQAWKKAHAWSAQAWPTNKYHAVKQPQTIERAGQSQAPRKYTQGIFYRARLPVTYYLYVKENLKLKGVRGAWKLRGSSTAFFENAAPVISVGIDRTFFANRETTLSFDNGVLQDVKITKGSELVNVVTIPLQIAQSIAALPANVISVKINQTNNNAALIQAQDSLIAARRLLATDQARAAPPIAVVAAAGGGRSLGNAAGPQSFADSNGDAGYGQCFNKCMVSNTVSNEPTCQKFCNCRVNLCGSQGDDASCQNNCSRYLSQ